MYVALLWKYQWSYSKHSLRCTAKNVLSQAWTFPQDYPPSLTITAPPTSRTMPQSSVGGTLLPDYTPSIDLLGRSQIFIIAVWPPAVWATVGLPAAPELQCQTRDQDVPSCAAATHVNLTAAGSPGAAWDPPGAGPTHNSHRVYVSNQRKK